MKDQLLDIVKHTRGYGFIDEIKVTADDQETKIAAIVDDKTVVFKGVFNKPIPELRDAGVFGMPNLNKLHIILNIPEYRDNAKISLVTDDRHGATGLHFENASGDFKNEYRFMAQNVVEQRIKTFSLAQKDWDVEFQPKQDAIKKMKMQMQANSEAERFKVSTVNGDLVFAFGEQSTHAGSFVFQSGVGDKLKRTWTWPVDKFSKVFDLGGEQTLRISDRGVAEFEVNSGLATYTYGLPATPL